MNQINSNFASIIQTINAAKFGTGTNIVPAFKVNQPFQNDAAFKVEAPDRFAMFDDVANNIAVFQDMLNYTNNNVNSMLEQGKSLCDLINKAREGDLSEENLSAIEDEVKARIEAIQNIRDNANYNGINPFDGAVSLNIPQWQDIFGVQDTEEKPAESTMSEVIASFTFDMSMAGNTDNSEFNVGATATVNIGYNEDGSLQIDVDTTMDFDLSGITSEGVGSDNALDIINNFINMLMGKQNGLNNANSLMENLFAQATASASIVGDGFRIDATNDIQFENESSKSLRGQIMQHASIVLDSSANLSPSIAINIL